MKYDNYAFKAAVRERMERTGEKYMAARRVLISEIEMKRNLPWLRTALQPGTVTAVVSGGGMTNWALTLPGLEDLRARGHRIMIAPHRSVRGLRAPASPMDFIGAAGLSSAQGLAELLARRPAPTRSRATTDGCHRGRELL